MRENYAAVDFRQSLVQALRLGNGDSMIIWFINYVNRTFGLTDKIKQIMMSKRLSEQEKNKRIQEERKNKKQQKERFFE